MRIQHALVILALAGCQNATVQDDAGFELPDTAPTPDAFAFPDAGDGTCGTSVGTTMWAPLPAACIPMCDEASRTALARCAPLDFQCRRDAVPFDAGTISRVGTMFGEQMVSCGGSRTGSVWPCFGWQETSCEAEFCPNEYTAYVTCLNGGGTCSAEDAAVLSCLNASTEYQACVTQRVSLC